MNSYSNYYDEKHPRYSDEQQYNHFPSNNINTGTNIESQVDDYWNRQAANIDLLVNNNKNNNNSSNELSLTSSLYFDQKLLAVTTCTSSTVTTTTTTRPALQEYNSSRTINDNFIHNNDYKEQFLYDCGCSGGCINPCRIYYNDTCKNNSQQCVDDDDVVDQYGISSSSRSQSSSHQTKYPIYNNKPDMATMEHYRLTNIMCSCCCCLSNNTNGLCSRNHQKIPYDWNHSSRRGQQYKESSDDLCNSNKNNNSNYYYSMKQHNEDIGTKHYDEPTLRKCIPTTNVDNNKVALQSKHYNPSLIPTEADNVIRYDNLSYEQIVKQYQDCSLGGDLSERTTCTGITTKISSSSSKNKKKQRQPQKITTIEIEPGHYERLRGAEETRHAVKHDHYVPIDCIGCDQTIFCIQDATYVCCPYKSCHIIGPNLNRTTTTTTTSSDGSLCGEGGGGGVGVGFTFKELAAWQTDILLETTAVLKTKQQQQPK